MPSRGPFGISLYIHFQQKRTYLFIVLLLMMRLYLLLYIHYTDKANVACFQHCFSSSDISRL